MKECLKYVFIFANIFSYFLIFSIKRYNEICTFSSLFYFFSYNVLKETSYFYILYIFYTFLKEIDTFI